MKKTFVDRDLVKFSNPIIVLGCFRLLMKAYSIYDGVYEIFLNLHLCLLLFCEEIYPHPLGHIESITQSPNPTTNSIFSLKSTSESRRIVQFTYLALKSLYFCMYLH